MKPLRLRPAVGALAIAVVAAACGAETDSAGAPAVTSAEVGAVPTTGAPGSDGSISGLGDETVSLDGLHALTDRAKRSIELTEIVIDTFDGSWVPYDEATNDQLVNLLDAIPPIDEPRFERGSSSTWLDDDELVLAVTGPDGTAFAAPHRQLSSHEIVHVTLDGIPLAVTFCPLCGSGAVFDRRLPQAGDDGLISFSNTSGLYESGMVMIDRQTGSLWSHFLGEAIVGDLTGTTMTLWSSQTATWGAWLEQHPDTWVMSEEQGFSRFYGDDPGEAIADSLNERQGTRFPSDPNAFDDRRLDPGTRVATVTDGELTHAVPADGPAGSVTIQLDNVTVTPDGSDERFDQVTVILDGEGGARVTAGVPAGDGTVGDPIPSSSAFWFTVVGMAPGEVRIHQVAVG